MFTVKKLVFAPFFLMIFFLLILNLKSLFGSYDFVFSLSVETLTALIILSVLICATSLTFILFASLSLDWIIILPTAIVASLLPMLFFNTQLGLIFAVANFAILILTFTNLENTMKSYLTFKPFAILSPSIRLLSTLLIMVICVIYFFSINKIISEKGFQIPNSLIDAAINLSSSGLTENAEKTPTPVLPQIPKEQIEYLKQNPDLLKQYGLDPSVLDSLDQKPTDQNNNLSKQLIKQAVKDQVDSFLEPYLGFVPALLAVFLFLTLQGITSLVNLLIYPLLGIIFFILEKTGFIKFTEEMRPVKKMVV